jgi:hypothetical protein
LSRLALPRWRNAKIVVGTTYGMTASQIHYSIAQPFRDAAINVHTPDPKFAARDFFANSLYIFRDG